MLSPSDGSLPSLTAKKRKYTRSENPLVQRKDFASLRSSRIGSVGDLLSSQIGTTCSCKYVVVIIEVCLSFTARMPILLLHSASAPAQKGIAAYQDSYLSSRVVRPNFHLNPPSLASQLRQKNAIPRYMACNFPFIATIVVRGNRCRCASPFKRATSSVSRLVSSLSTKLTKQPPTNALVFHVTVLIVISLSRQICW